MIFCYNSSNLDWLLWHICEKTCLQNANLYFFDKKTTINEISGKIFEQSLFDFSKKDDKQIFVIDISGWNLRSKIYKNFLEMIVQSDKKIILFSTGSLNANDPFFIENGIKIFKVYKPYLDSKIKIIDFCLAKHHLQLLSPDVKNYLYKNLPFDYFFINCEIQKLVLLSKSYSLDVKILQDSLIVLSEDNVFAIIHLWLGKQYYQCISLIEKFVSLGNNVATIMHIFATQLFQIKMYLLALQKTKWNPKKITEKLGLSSYQQKKFSVFNTYHEDVLGRINKNLLKLYELDVDIKTKKILAFSAFVQKLLYD